MRLTFIINCILINLLKGNKYKMYVCICNALTSEDVRKLKNIGVCDPNSVYKKLGCAMQCGKCLQSIDEILREKSVSVKDTKEQIGFSKKFSSSLRA